MVTLEEYRGIHTDHDEGLRYSLTPQVVERLHQHKNCTEYWYTPETIADIFYRMVGGRSTPYVIIQKTDKRVVGGLVIHNRTHVVTTTIWVNEHLQGHGYGTEALRQALATLKNKEYEYVLFTIERSNTPALRLMEKIGAKRQPYVCTRAFEGRVWEYDEYKLFPK